MEKVFIDTDNWDETNGVPDISFSFKVNKKKKKELLKQSRKRKLDDSLKDTENDSVGGKYVRAPKYFEDEIKSNQLVESDSEVNRKKRKRKLRKTSDNSPVVPEKKVKPGVETEHSQHNNFGDTLRDNLKGSRFRFLNELMYKQKGKESMSLFKDDPTAYDAYHEGYRHQISNWPMNPLDRIINGIKRLPKNHVIADMGCGDARLSTSVLHKVISLDLVSKVDGVIECDMANTPLESNSVHVVVYCLSLMGTNLKDFFLEANRILKIGGLIKIAEVSSRFSSIDDFVNFVCLCGFEMVSKDLSHNLFYFINFKKSQEVNNFMRNIQDYSLKPCLYKKR